MNSKAKVLPVAFLWGCATSLDPTQPNDSDSGAFARTDALPAPDARIGDANEFRDSRVEEDASPELDSGLVGPAVGLDPLAVADLAQPISEASMIASAISGLVTEIASDRFVAPALGMQNVPSGDVMTVANDVTERADNLLGGCAGGENHLNRCPVVINCPRRTLIRYGDGCIAPSGKHIRGEVTITNSETVAQHDTWVFDVSFDSGASGRIHFRGSMDAERRPGELVFTQRSDQIHVDMPERGNRLRERGFGLQLENIVVSQDPATLAYSVSGPDTYYLNDVPIQCASGTVLVDYQIEDCGGWQFPVPLTECLCPVAGELRAIGPFLDPCNAPLSKQELVVDFSAGSSCGQGFGVILYTPDTQCEPGCGTCSKGICLGPLCTNAVDLSAVATSMVGWICELPKTACASVFDGGACPTIDGGLEDGPSDSGVRDVRDFGTEGDGGARDATDPNQIGDAGPRDATVVLVDGGARDADLPPIDGGGEGHGVTISGAVMNAAQPLLPVANAAVTVSGGASASTGLLGRYQVGAPANAQLFIRAEKPAANFVGVLYGLFTQAVPVNDVNFYLQPFTTFDQTYASVGLTRNPSKGHLVLQISTTSTTGGMGADLSLPHEPSFSRSQNGTNIASETTLPGTQEHWLAFPNVDPGVTSVQLIAPTAGPSCQALSIQQWEVRPNVLTVVGASCP
ncbi:MAG: hypothetical protein HYV07_29640 [Deltaproteobacteria bacterium]|nr:hypothetical protein [Deltaproteobacteria bacterium]